MQKQERKVPGYHMLVKADAVESAAEEKSVLEWAKVQASESAAAVTERAEETCRGEGRDVDCLPSQTPQQLDLALPLHRIPHTHTFKIFIFVLHYLHYLYGIDQMVYYRQLEKKLYLIWRLAISVGGSTVREELVYPPE